MLSITKEQLAQLPPVEYDGRIHIIDTVSGVRDAVSYMSKCDLIGFDTETRPTFTKGKSHNVALLQLATDDECFLMRINKVGLPDMLRGFLEATVPVKVGLSIKDDFHNLAKLSPINPKGFIDLQEYVKRFGISDCSLTKIHAIIFGKRISKSQQLTNWEAQVLTPRQQEYAALDALACINIYRALNNGDFNPETSIYRRLKETE